MKETRDQVVAGCAGTRLAARPALTYPARARTECLCASESDKMVAYFERDGSAAAGASASEGECFIPSELTRGPWSPEHQHGGPPSALLARACARFEASPRARVVRLTIELLRPIPLRPLRVTASSVLVGRIARRVSASLWDGDKELARALALRLATVEPAESVPAAPAGPTLDAPRPPAEAAPIALPFMTGAVGYHSSIALRLERGTIGCGAVRTWMRPMVELVAGESMAPLERVVVCADSGNGVSQVLDPARYSFVNADLGIHLQREAVGDWICLDAESHIAPDGIGLADTRLWDEAGPIGRGEQLLVVRRREP